LAVQAAKIRPNLPIRFTTGFTRNAVVHNGIVDEGVQLLHKPFTLEQLSNKLAEMLNVLLQR
jgi:hypothetical protein